MVALFWKWRKYVIMKLGNYVIITDGANNELAPCTATFMEPPKDLIHS
jgi:hypothetical protein